LEEAEQVLSGELVAVWGFVGEGWRRVNMV
jgi:hypothetical protein